MFGSARSTGCGRSSFEGSGTGAGTEYEPSSIVDEKVGGREMAGGSQ